MRRTVSRGQCACPQTNGVDTKRGVRGRLPGTGSPHVGGVPEHDRGDDEVEAGGAKLLRLGTAVGNPALFAGLV